VHLVGPRGWLARVGEQAAAPDRASALAWLIVIVVLAFALQGDRALWEPDEGRYTDIAIQMIDSGDWWVPRLSNEQPHLAKPPVTYWLEALSLQAFGSEEWAARLPYGVAFLLTAVLVASLARSLRYPHPNLAAVVWATSLGPFTAANVITTDAIVTLFESAAVAAFVRSGGVTQATLDVRWTRLMWAMFAAAFMTKGPPALLPLLSIVAWRVWQYRPGGLRNLFDRFGVVLFLVLGLTWYIAMVVREPGVLHYFLRYELTDRVLSDVHGRNPHWWGAFTVYVPTLILGTLPWTVCRALRPAPLCITAPDERRRFLWLWLAIPLTVFALARSRLPFYLLPSFVPLALLVVPSVAAAERRYPRSMGVLAFLWLIALLAIRGSAAHIPTSQDSRELAREVRELATCIAGPIGELAFVDDTPAWGLRFYMGMPIEQMQVTPRARTYSEPLAAHSVCPEARDGDHRLWIVADRVVPAFEQVTRDCGYTPLALPSVMRGRQAFELSSGPGAQGASPALTPRRAATLPGSCSRGG
jgi:4-amino-4-deoxy-L-arabinose transferase-like glycosyltransferase